MLFNSTAFAVFFVVVFGMYWAMKRHYRAQNVFLLVASYVFYGWWDVRFLFLIVLSTVIDYCLALYIHHGRLRPGERTKASIVVIGAALLFVFVRWDALHVTGMGFLTRVRIDWSQLVWPSRVGEGVLLGTLASVGIAHVFYPLLARLDETRRRKVGMVISIVCNLSILGFFKYFNFFVGSFAALAHTAFGLEPSFLRYNWPRSRCTRRRKAPWSQPSSSSSAQWAAE